MTVNIDKGCLRGVLVVLGLLGGIGGVVMGIVLTIRGMALQSSPILDAVGYYEPPYADALIPLGMTISIIGFVGAWLSFGYLIRSTLMRVLGEKKGSVVYLTVILIIGLVTIAFWVRSWAGPLPAVAGTLAIVMMLAGAILWGSTRHRELESD